MPCVDVLRLLDTTIPLANSLPPVKTPASAPIGTPGQLGQRQRKNNGAVGPHQQRTDDAAGGEAASLLRPSTVHSLNQQPFEAAARVETKMATRRPETGDRFRLESTTKQTAMTTQERQGGNTPRARALANLIPRLSQYTRGSDRRQILRTLSDPRQTPAMHTLQSVWVEDIAAAEREAAGERAVLNGVKFLQVKSPSGEFRVDAMQHDNLPLNLIALMAPNSLPRQRPRSPATCPSTLTSSKL